MMSIVKKEVVKRFSCLNCGAPFDAYPPDDRHDTVARNEKVCMKTLSKLIIDVAIAVTRAPSIWGIRKWALLSSSLFEATE